MKTQQNPHISSVIAARQNALEFKPRVTKGFIQTIKLGGSQLNYVERYLVPDKLSTLSSMVISWRK